MATIASLAERTKAYLPDNFAELDLTERRDAAVEVALELVSDDLPHVLASRVTSQPVDASTLSGWNTEWSKPLWHEWPIISDNVPFAPDMKGESILVDNTGDIEQIRLLHAVPSVSTPALLRYAVRWTASELPSSMEELVALKASAVLAQMLSGTYGSSTDIDIGGQTVLAADDKVETYGDLAQALESLYRQMLKRSR